MKGPLVIASSWLLRLFAVLGLLFGVHWCAVRLAARVGWIPVLLGAGLLAVYAGVRFLRSRRTAHRFLAGLRARVTARSDPVEEPPELVADRS